MEDFHGRQVERDASLPGEGGSRAVRRRHLRPPPATEQVLEVPLRGVSLLLERRGGLIERHPIRHFFLLRKVVFGEVELT